ncbi:cell division protein DivIVA [Serinibacter salmoneus]|uniref:DivIVA domain-containing protein n=1 Tax=Serinibacter salmoneus TaxID=556530 RepID=A0A2A9CZA0_9MICO|nr:cell division protein DivIVA [Serinibacter salmoneus]PFG19325.1 DivIVA domain-containing protein [Serinibacter salmoneus]
MSETTKDLFPRVSGMTRGYDTQQVNAFIAAARAQYENREDAPQERIDANAIRATSFDLVRGGYQPAVVDAALDRLESAFVAAARTEFIREHGQDAWMSRVVERATELYGRLTRPAGEKFAPPEHGRGYAADEVDELMAKLTAYFDHGTPLSAAAVRTATFSSAPRSRAYAEGPVDAFLDHAVDVLMSVE